MGVSIGTIKFKFIFILFFYIAIIHLLIPQKLLSKTAVYDVVYLWDDNLGNVLDYMDEVGRLLGPTVYRNLLAVKNKNGKFGLIYNINVSKTRADRTAQSHTKILNKYDFPAGAISVEDCGYEALFNVSYGVGQNLIDLKNKYKIISSRLGKEVARNLVIEKMSEKKYALVYKRYAELEQIKKLTERHKKILAPEKIDAAFIIEKNNRIVYGEASMLDEEEKPNGIKYKKDIKKYKEKRKEIFENRLSRELKKYIKELIENKNIASDEKIALSVYDIKSGIKLVSINEDEPFQAASMIKPFVMLAYFTDIMQKKQEYKNKDKSYLERMIQNSDNSATNYFIRKLGGPKKVNSILMSGYPAIFKETAIVEYIPSGGKTYKNKASAHDYSRFLYDLWRRSLPFSKEMLRILALPSRNRLYTGTKQIPDGTLLYSKTGTTSRLCGDMGIVVGKDKQGNRIPYIIIAMIEKKNRSGNYARWMIKKGNVIRFISDKIYSFMAEKHNL